MEKNSRGAAPILVWYRQDLRTVDHPALFAAAKTGTPVIPVYVLDDKTPSEWSMGGASRWWLHESLLSLQSDLQSCGSQLILKRGESIETIGKLVEETGARAIYFTRHYEPNFAKAEAALAGAYTNSNVDVRRFSGHLLFEPEAIRTKTDTPFKVFTPFYKACLSANLVKGALLAPRSLAAPDTWPESENLGDWALQPTAPDWAGGLRSAWQPGASAAIDCLESFLDERAANYASERDRPDRSGTSRLSPYLHFGEISPRQIWQRTLQASHDAGSGDKGRTAYLRELIWREFSYHLLHHWPEIPSEPFNAVFTAFPWREDAEALSKWQRGQTGYPIVDAGMRELWHTGWMHNRVRMIVASFLTKHLLIHWRKGAEWFWDTLVDANLANNSASWQWVAGSGADAAPYFRIFNPILQGQKFDPQGVYVRKWIPELSGVPDKDIHTPWLSGVDVNTYPSPIVDHKVARERALAAYKEIKS